MQKSLFEMCNVEISYNGESVVHDVSLKLKPSEILGIVGESGSGKSTLIKAAMGLLGNYGEISKGDIFYKENNLLNIKPEALRKMRGPEMGMIFQNCASALIMNMAIDLFQKMNLDGRRILESYPFELSGGMNQRVGIVMAMMLKPNLLFADEPTSDLDVIAQAQVVDVLIKLRNEFGTAIIIVTHNIGLVSYMADKVAVMRQGHFVEYGDVKDVIYNPREDYTKRLIEVVPKIRKE